MKKISFITIILFLLCCRLVAQDISFSIGYGSYSMGDLKSEMKYLQMDYPVQPKIVENFPDYLCYDFSFAFPLNEQFSLGGFYTLMSTGGRMSYQDQTGSILVDMPIKGQYVGVINRFKLTDSDKFVVNGMLRGGLVFSKMEALEKITLGNSIATQEPILKSTNLSIDIGFDGMKYLYKNFYACASLAYHLTIEAHNLEDVDGEYDMKADWSGGRLSIGLGFSVK